jgi:hypothetical protein
MHTQDDQYRTPTRIHIWLLLLLLLLFTSCSSMINYTMHTQSTLREQGSMLRPLLHLGTSQP